MKKLSILTYLHKTTMAHNIKQDWLSENILGCSLCLEQLNNPKSLPCVHTFCLKCLQEYVSTRKFSNSLPCPLCKKETTIPGNDVQNFPTNFMVQSMIAQLQQTNANIVAIQPAELEKKKTGDESTCQGCERTDSVCNFCSTCELWFCECCVTAHQKIPLTREHHILNNKDVKRECDTRAAEKKTEILDMKDQLNKKIEIFKDKHSRITKDIKEVKEQIESKAANVHKLIDNQVEDLTERVDNYFRADHQGISDVLTDADNIMSDIENVFTLFEKIKNLTDGRSCQKLLKQVGDFLTEKTRVVEQVNQKEFGDIFMSFCDDDSGTTKFNIGHVCEHFCINVAKEDKTTLSLWVKQTNSAQDVIEMVKQAVGGVIAAHAPCLSFDGTKLEEHQSLSDLNVQRNSRLDLVSKYMTLDDFANYDEYKQYIYTTVKPGDRIKRVRNVNNDYIDVPVGDVGIVTVLYPQITQADWLQSGQKSFGLYNYDIEITN